MKKFALGFGVLIVLGIVIGGLNFNRTSDTKYDSVALATYEEIKEDFWFTDSIKDNEDGDSEDLNDIRFANFKDEDWLDNDYIRCLRKYLDYYNNGKIKDEDLEPYKEKIKGKFVIIDVIPTLGGGLRILFIFIDFPEYMFCSHVYSIVDMKKKVASYSVQYICMSDNEYDMTKEEILDSLKVHPEMKLW